jgi:cell division protein FtsB
MGCTRPSRAGKETIVSERCARCGNPNDVFNYCPAGEGGEPCVGVLSKADKPIDEMTRDEVRAELEQQGLLKSTDWFNRRILPVLLEDKRLREALAEKDKQIAAALEKVSYWQQCHSQTAEAMRVSSEANTRLRQENQSLRAEVERLKTEVLQRTFFGPPKPGDQPAARAGGETLREIARSNSDLTDKELSSLAEMAQSFDRLVHEMLYWDAWGIKQEGEIAALKARITELAKLLSDLCDEYVNLHTHAMQYGAREHTLDAAVKARAALHPVQSPIPS